MCHVSNYVQVTCMQKIKISFNLFSGTFILQKWKEMNMKKYISQSFMSHG